MHLHKFFKQDDQTYLKVNSVIYFKNEGSIQTEQMHKLENQCQ